MAASESVAAAETEYGTLDQLVEPLVEVVILGVILAREVSVPAARLDLETEGETPVGLGFVGADVALRPRRVAALLVLLRGVLGEAQVRAIEPELESSRRDGRRRGVLERRERPPSKARQACRSRRQRQRPAAAQTSTECTERPGASGAHPPSPVKPDIGCRWVKRNRAEALEGSFFYAFPQCLERLFRAGLGPSSRRSPPAPISTKAW